MARTPKFDPLHQVKIEPKFEKSIDLDHKLIRSEGGQDISAYKISGHFLQAFSGKYLKTQNLTFFTKSMLCHKEENQQIMTIT